MPLFPGEETGPSAPELSMASCPDSLPGTTPRNDLPCWKETLQYAAVHTETGTFGMGWLAAAAAKLGLGKDALMLLYEKGIDYVLHDNGLAYEESPRFLNYCHLTKPAHYLPVMMEAAGGILNAINLMLLQTTPSGEIRVFPAVPKGKEELTLYQVQYAEELTKARTGYEDWDDISFEGFLTPDGFRVSAEQKNFRVTFLAVESTRNALLKLILPGELSPDGNAHKLERFMQKGQIISFGNAAEAKAEKKTKPPALLCHPAAWTHRRIFLGGQSPHQISAGCRCHYLSLSVWQWMELSSNTLHF